MLDARSDPGKPKTDEELFASFIDNDDHASLQVLIDKYHSPAMAFAVSRIGNHHAAGDIVQETLVRIVTNSKKFDFSKSFASWFYAILRNACVDEHRKKTRRCIRFLDYAAASEVTSEPVYPDFSDDLMQSLSDEDRDILVLRVINGLTFTEISDVLGCSTDAAKKRSQRALKRLRENICN